LIKRATVLVASSGVLAALALIPVSASLMPVSASANTVCSGGVYNNLYCHKICVVPKLRGKTVRRARHLLLAHDCRLGKIFRRPGKGVAIGRVLKSRPKRGTKHPRGTKVNIYVRKK
jgi:beta-lactam-binding protein with PASTA domain